MRKLLPEFWAGREAGLTDDYKNLTETELANLAVKNDEYAFAEIVRRFSPRVFRVVSRFFRRHSLIEEAAQEVFLKAFVQIGNYEKRGSLEGWLTRIAVTTCLNLLRAAKRQPELTVSDLTDDETAWLEEKFLNSSVTDYRNEEEKIIAADLLERLLKTVSPEDGFVLTAIDGECESIKDLAEITGWSESKVKVKAFRARRRIRGALQKLLQTHEDKFYKSRKVEK